jgi:Fe-S-cluster containining protein
MKAFECKMCGECCYGIGGIFMEAEEQERIAAYLELSLSEFLHQYTETRNGRIYAEIGKNNYCIFFKKGQGCTIHPVKPARCALWPFFPANVVDRDTWDAAKLACPGINRECSFENFVNEFANRNSEKK